MSHLIAFVFCIALLVLAGGGIKTGMVLLAVVFAMLMALAGHQVVRIFLGDPRQ